MLTFNLETSLSAKCVQVCIYISMQKRQKTGSMQEESQLIIAALISPEFFRVCKGCLAVSTLETVL